MLKTNEKQLVIMALQGKVAYPDEFLPFEVGHDGIARALPGTGSITYNVRVGDPAFGWASDHTEPGVSTVCTSDEKPYTKGYNFLSCCGNEVRVISGDAKNAKGTVIGTHGGVEHVMLDFPQKVLEQLTLEDKFLIKSVGQGLRLLDYPEILCYNLSPALLKKMNVREKKGGLEIGVTHILPSEIMGSGIGSLSATRGDYDISTQDPASIKKYRLGDLRLGDIIAILDADNSFGRCFKRGAVSIGIVIHSNSYAAGHGPGVMTLMTCAKAKIKPFIDKHANIAEILKIGRYGK